MHSHCEIILPPETTHVKAAIARILAPWREQEADPDYEPFFDWYVIGGRWSGEKVLTSHDPDAINRFEALLRDKGFTVSAVHTGKPTLVPETQCAQVDALWREHFPDSLLTQCPLFDHYKAEDLDICRLRHVSPKLTCARLIIADTERALFMLVDQIWTGTHHQKTAWDSTVLQGVELAKAHYTPIEVSPDALVVTVDYHS